MNVTRATPPDRRARLGLARSFQRNNLFTDLTVRENLAIACAIAHRVSHVAWKAFARHREVHESAEAQAAALGLGEVLDTVARHLSYGTQRQLEIALALALEPKILLLDEPTAGMSPEETAAMQAMIAALPATLTLLVIEHDMEVLFGLADRITVLDYGKVLLQGEPREVRDSDVVRSRYLGRSERTRNEYARTGKGTATAGGSTGDGRNAHPRAGLRHGRKPAPEDVTSVMGTREQGAPWPRQAASPGAAAGTPSLLALDAVDAFYDRSHVLQALSMEVESGTVVALLGRNGAGKTTTLKTVMGIVPVRAGRMRFDGADVTGLPTHRIARLGIAYVPEDRGIFASLTVHEHLTLANVPDGWPLGRIYEAFPRLAERRGHRGTQLSGGEQQMLSIARALTLAPRLLILDEPPRGWRRSSWRRSRRSPGG